MMRLIIKYIALLFVSIAIFGCTIGLVASDDTVFGRPEIFKTRNHILKSDYIFLNSDGDYLWSYVRPDAACVFYTNDETSTVSIDENNSNLPLIEKLSVYQNPFHDFAVIEQSENLEFQIFNIKGIVYESGIYKIKNSGVIWKPSNNCK